VSVQNINEKVRRGLIYNSTMFVLYNDVIFIKKDKTAVKKSRFKMVTPGCYQFTTNGLCFYLTAINDHQ